MLDATGPDIVDLVADLSAASNKLGSRLHPQSAAGLADAVRVMTCYHFNLIEGHNTTPRDIEQPLAAQFAGTEERRNLQVAAGMPSTSCPKPVSGNIAPAGTRNNAAPHKWVSARKPLASNRDAWIWSDVHLTRCYEKKAPRTGGTQGKFREETPVTRQDEEDPRPAGDHPPGPPPAST